MKENNLSFKNIFKRETKLATYIIAVTTILVLGLSYALFFQVHSNSQNQVVQSGDLAFTYSKDGTVVPDGNINLQITDPTCFSPMTEADADSLINTCSYQFSIQNTGTLKAFYQMFLKATENNTANPEHLKVILRESDGTIFNKMTGYPKTVKSINDNEGILLSGDLDKNSNILVYNIQVYLDESLASDADYSSKVISYKLEGKSVVHEDQPIANGPTAGDEIIGLVRGADPTATDEIDNGTDASGCTNTLAYDDFGNLRYTGINPCNYVVFNNEVPEIVEIATDEIDDGYGDYSEVNISGVSGGWRIIGVFDGKLKLIRNSSIGEFAWDVTPSDINFGYGINQWGESGTYNGADLMKLLNPGYEDNSDELYHYEQQYVSDGLQLVNNSLYWNRTYGECYGGYNVIHNDCDFSYNGLLDGAKSMISQSSWYLGTIGDPQTVGTAEEFYEYERSNNTGKICSSGSECNDTVSRTTTWQGYVGLMYPSDYGYAVGGEARDICLSATVLTNYGDNSCNINDWLFAGWQWTISPGVNYDSSSYASASTFSVEMRGASEHVAVRPVVYLISSVEFTSGTGSPDDPYIIALQ